MKKAMGFALAVLATAVVATTAQGGQKVAATSRRRSTARARSRSRSSRR